MAYKRYEDLRRSGKAGNDELALAAVACAESLFHFREAIPASEKESRAAISARCPDFKLLGDIANAIKHRKITRDPSDGPALVRSPEDIYELYVVINIPSPDGDYSHMEAVVCARGTDGHRYYLDDSIVNVLNFWGDWLQNSGRIVFRPRQALPFPGTIAVSKELARKITLNVARGSEFRSEWQLMKFDSSLGYAKPVPLSKDADKVGFSMYRPRHTLEIRISKDELPDDIVLEVELTDEQSQQYLQLEDGQLRENFSRKIVESKSAEIEELIRKHSP